MYIFKTNFRGRFKHLAKWGPGHRGDVTLKQELPRELINKQSLLFHISFVKSMYITKRERKTGRQRIYAEKHSCCDVMARLAPGPHFAQSFTNCLHQDLTQIP